MTPGIVSPPHAVLSPDEWRRLGRERRKVVSRSSHAEWDPPPSRPDPVAILQEQAGSRLSDVVGIRHARMAASPFPYFRGAAAPMAWDLAHTPTTDIRVQACGDAHLLNFGIFAAPDRRLVFDVNDFDETLPAPFEWDVKRLAASLVIAGRVAAMPEADCRHLARVAVKSYRAQLAHFADLPPLDAWNASVDLVAAFDEIDPSKLRRT